MNAKFWGMLCATAAVAAFATASTASGPCADAGCFPSSEQCTLSTCNVSESDGSLNYYYYYCSNGSGYRWDPENNDSECVMNCGSGGGSDPDHTLDPTQDDDGETWGDDCIGWC